MPSRSGALIPEMVQVVFQDRAPKMWPEFPGFSVAYTDVQMELPHSEIDWRSGQHVYGREQSVYPYCLGFGLENLEYQPSLGFSVRVKSLLNCQLAYERDVFLPYFLQKGKDLMKNIQWTNSKTEPPCLLAILSWGSFAAHLHWAVKPTETKLSLMVTQATNQPGILASCPRKSRCIIFFTPL